MAIATAATIVAPGIAAIGLHPAAGANSVTTGSGAARPVVSLRICRDGYGRYYVDRGSRRLVYYVGRRHHRDRLVGVPPDKNPAPHIRMTGMCRAGQTLS